MTKLPHELLTLVEAASRVNLDPSTLRTQIHEGRLVGQKIGRDWFVTPKALQAYLDQRWTRTEKKKATRGKV